MIAFEQTTRYASALAKYSQYYTSVCVNVSVYTAFDHEVEHHNVHRNGAEYRLSSHHKFLKLPDTLHT